VKFDVVVMNPPYQTKSNDKYKKTQAIWPAFVRLAFQHCEDNGYVAAVHPSGWRNISGAYKDIQFLLKYKQMLFLKMHSYKEGNKIFGANTNFDYYCIKNTRNNNQLTTIICEDLSKYSLDISKMDFIPSENITEIQSVIAKPDEEKVEILYSCTDYETRKSWMSETKSDKFCYPCVYTVKSPNKNNIPRFYYSKTKDKGHFGFSKVIWGNGASGVFVDINGNYGLTQYAYAIVDEPDNLENIKKALLSQRFIRSIMCYKHSLGHKYNKRIISTLRKDFWKEFI